MPDRRTTGRSEGATLPSLPAAVLHAVLPIAERDEVLADLASELAERERRDGAWSARLWCWRQVTLSLPALLRRSWWRGASGFEPVANRTRPGGPSMEGWIIDVRYAARYLVRRPLYLILSVLTLALGVGGTAAVYSIARGVLLDPLPYKDEDRITLFWMTYSWTGEEFTFFRGRVPGFSSVALYRPEDVTLDRGDAAAQLLPGMSTSAELFDVLGTRPALGRGFQSGDDVPGAERVAVLSYGLWQELGGNSSIVGSRLRLDGVERTVVGVMPRGFWFPDPNIRVWVAEPIRPDARSGVYSLVGRVASGFDARAMDGPLGQFKKMLGDRFKYPPQWDKTESPKVTLIREELLGSLKPALVATFTAMAAILLIACANVAALMLGQVEGRSTELSVKSALGANRRRLARQLGAEALLLGLGAGVAGALLAVASFRLLVGALPLGAWGQNAALDWRLFLAAMAVAVLAALLVAVAPTAALWRGDLRGSLAGGRTAGIKGRGGRLENSLVVAEVALSVLMAAGAGLLIRSVTNLYRIDPGIELEGTGVVDVAMPDNMNNAQRRQALLELTQAMEGVAGIKSAAATEKLPLRGDGDNWGVEIEGRPELGEVTTAIRMVTPGYFETLGITLRQGRTLQASDLGAYRDSTVEPAIVVNDAFVKKFFADVSPLGRRVATGGGNWGRVVGVVENVAETDLTAEPVPTRYYAYDIFGFVQDAEAIAFRTTPGTDPAAVIDGARRAVQQAAPSVAVQEATSMRRVFERAVGPARQVMVLVSILTALALTLGAVGIYGVISHFVMRRKRDWGVRIALGLEPTKVIGGILRRGTMLVVVGIVIGVAAFLVLARLLSSFLYGVGAADPAAIAGSTVALLLVGVIAALVPAFRASRTDPAIVLRDQ